VKHFHIRLRAGSERVWRNLVTLRKGDRLLISEVSRLGPVEKGESEGAWTDDAEHTHLEADLSELVPKIHSATIGAVELLQVPYRASARRR
jgi:hypothetical protein